MSGHDGEPIMPSQQAGGARYPRDAKRISGGQEPDARANMDGGQPMSSLRPIIRDWLDYVIVEDGRDIRRLYDDRHVAPSIDGFGRSRCTSIPSSS